MRINKYLAECGIASRRACDKLIGEGRVKVNGKRQTPDYRLRQGDVVELYINDEFFAAAPQKAVPTRKLPPLKVVYEDEALAVLYKPAHLLCHGDRTGDVSLVDAFIAYLAQKGEFDPQVLKKNPTTRMTAATILVCSASLGTRSPTMLAMP